MHCAPLGISLGKHTPLAAAIQQVQHRVEDFVRTHGSQLDRFRISSNKGRTLSNCFRLLSLGTAFLYPSSIAIACASHPHISAFMTLRVLEDREQALRFIRMDSMRSSSGLLLLFSFTTMQLVRRRLREPQGNLYQQHRLGGFHRDSHRRNGTRCSGPAQTLDARWRICCGAVTRGTAIMRVRLNGNPPLLLGSHRRSPLNRTSMLISLCITPKRV